MYLNIEFWNVYLKSIIFRLKPLKKYFFIFGLKTLKRDFYIAKIIKTVNLITQIKQIALTKVHN